MTDGSQPKPTVPREVAAGADLALEVVLLLIFGVFMLLFGVLTPPIHRAALPYSPDSAYGLFLVLVSLQVITLGKTPFGDLRRSWIVVMAGICAGLFGMSACFIPGRLTDLIRLAVGGLLFAGGVTLLLQLVLSEDKGRAWMRGPWLLKHIATACGLVYIFSIASGMITLFPGFAHDDVTAGLLVVFGASFLYLAGTLQILAWVAPAREEGAAPGGTAAGVPRARGVSLLLREATLPLSVAAIVLLAVMLTFLGLVLTAVNLGLLPFSPSGLQGVQLVVFAIQMMALGETPVGSYKRSWPIIALGIAFVGLGAFSSIVPDLLTDALRWFLGLLNVFAGGSFFVRRLLQKGTDGEEQPPIARKIEVTQKILNAVVIAFGIAMFVPSLVPGLVNALIIVANGALLFTLASFLWRLDREMHP